MFSPSLWQELRDGGYRIEAGIEYKAIDFRLIHPEEYTPRSLFARAIAEIHNYNAGLVFYFSFPSSACCYKLKLHINSSTYPLNAYQKN